MPKAVLLSLMKHLHFPHFKCVYSIDLLELEIHLEVAKVKISNGYCSFENCSADFIRTIATSSSGPSLWPLAWPAQVVLGNLNHSFSPELLN